MVSYDRERERIDKEAEEECAEHEQALKEAEKEKWVPRKSKAGLPLLSAWQLRSTKHPAFDCVGVPFASEKVAANWKAESDETPFYFARKVSRLKTRPKEESMKLKMS